MKTNYEVTTVYVNDMLGAFFLSSNLNLYVADTVIYLFYKTEFVKFVYWYRVHLW